MKDHLTLPPLISVLWVSTFHSSCPQSGMLRFSFKSQKDHTVTYPTPPKKYTCTVSHNTLKHKR